MNKFSIALLVALSGTVPAATNAQVNPTVVSTRPLVMTFVPKQSGCSGWRVNGQKNARTLISAVTDSNTMPAANIERDARLFRACKLLATNPTSRTQISRTPLVLSNQPMDSDDGTE